MTEKLRSAICFSLFAWIVCAGRLSAQSTQVQVGRYSVTCTDTNGQLVYWYPKSDLNDVGYTTQQGILYNPTVLKRFSFHLRLFWLGHECGHAHLGTTDESEADCWSAKTGVAQGWFDANDANALAQEMKGNPGDNKHPPGPERVANVRVCMGELSRSPLGGGGHGQMEGLTQGPGFGPGMVRGLPPQKSPPLQDDPTPKNLDEKQTCMDLRQIVASASINFVDITGGHRTPHSAFTSIRLPMATSCFISTTSTAAYECHFPKSYDAKLVKSLAACFPDADESNGESLTTFDLKSIGNLSFEVLTDRDILLQITARKQ